MAFVAQSNDDHPSIPCASDNVSGLFLLLQEFYYYLAPRDRPHIFGMTASPVNVRVTQSLERVPETIAELETMLNAKA